MAKRKKKKSTYPGCYHTPKENWFMLPNAWIGWTVGMRLCELRVLIYIIRHTWGWQNYNKYCHLTLDEFQYGRKLKNGTRLDDGCGLSKPSIIEGLVSLERRGHIITQTNGKDKARIKKRYKLRMESDGKNFNPSGEGEKTLPSSAKTFASDQIKESLEGKKANSRGETPQREHAGNGFLDDRQFASKKYKASPEQTELANLLYKTLKAKRLLQKLPKLPEWAEEFRLLEKEIPPEEIEETLRWYLNNIGGPYIPEAFCGKSFRSKYIKIRQAMIRAGEAASFEEEQEIEETDIYNRSCALLIKDHPYKDGTGIRSQELLPYREEAIRQLQRQAQRRKEKAAASKQQASKNGNGKH